LGTQTALRLHGVSGTVAVTGAPGVALPVSVTGVRRVEADTLEDATAQLAALQVDVTSSATEVLVETVQPQFAAGRNYIVNYTIVVPEHLDVSVMTLNGDVTVRLLNGDCMIMNTNGRIQADTIVGNAILSSVNGDITASVTLPSAGQIDIGLANGTIDLGIPQATSAQFSATVGIGSITLTNLTLSNDTATPGSRSGTLGGGDGTIELDVGNGTIAVRGF
ncbi:MAG: DUF4097 family beta strand repeat-containing protein, partial [Myxococcales bacterium]|nr:DUF4097 family beta strand repeat-containing protein [Myxococcales bacterium]